MNSEKSQTDSLSLVEQRLLLRLKIRTQREMIATKLGSVPVDNIAYPRSKTMRFLTQRRGHLAKLSAEFTVFFIGARIIKFMGKTIRLAKIIQTALHNK